MNIKDTFKSLLHSILMSGCRKVFCIFKNNMKSLPLSFVVLIITFNSFGQITKNNWMLGGSGKFSSRKDEVNSLSANSINIEVSSTIGYFFADKFAAGIKPGIAYNKLIYQGPASHYQLLSIGPFARYYFLPVENRINLFAESAYQYGRYSGSLAGGHESQSIYTFSAGPVIYFNSSVGLELMLEYEIINRFSGQQITRTLSFGIGFQIHLEKE